jgi:hypothetical protein
MLFSEGEHEASDQCAGQRNTASTTQLVFDRARSVDARNATVNVVAGAQHNVYYKDMDTGAKIVIVIYPSFNYDPQIVEKSRTGFRPSISSRLRSKFFKVGKKGLASGCLNPTDSKTGATGRRFYGVVEFVRFSPR